MLACSDGSAVLDSFLFPAKCVPGGGRRDGAHGDGYLFHVGFPSGIILSSGYHVRYGADGCLDCHVCGLDLPGSLLFAAVPGR